MSRKLLNILIVGVFLMLPMMAQAETRIAVVNLNRVLEKAPQQRLAVLRLKREFSARNRRLIAQRKRLRKLEIQRVRRRITMSPAQLRKLESRIRSLRRKIRRAQEDYREDLNIRKNQELRRLHKLVIRTIHRLAIKRKYDLVLTDAIYASKSVNITKDVLKSLEAQARAAVKTKKTK